MEKEKKEPRVRKERAEISADARKSPRQTSRVDYNETKKRAPKKEKKVKEVKKRRRSYDSEEEDEEEASFEERSKRPKRNSRSSYYHSEDEDSIDIIIDEEDDEEEWNINFGDSDEEYDPDTRIVVNGGRETPKRNRRSTPNPKDPGIFESGGNKRQSTRLAGKKRRNYTIYGEGEDGGEESGESQIRIILTGLKDRNPYDFTDAIFQMGGEVVSDIDKCTHLVSSSLSVRTENLLCGFRYSRYMLHISWLLDSIDNRAFLDEKSYILKDPEAEEKWNFNFSESRELAVKHREQGLFGNCLFGLTTHTNNKGIERIIELNGGTIIKKQEDIPDKSFDHHIVLTTEEDSPEWSDLKFLKPVYLEKEFLFTSIMRQTLSIPEFDLEKKGNANSSSSSTSTSTGTSKNTGFDEVNDPSTPPKTKNATSTRASTSRAKKTSTNSSSEFESDDDIVVISTPNTRSTRSSSTSATSTPQAKTTTSTSSTSTPQAKATSASSTSTPQTKETSTSSVSTPQAKETSTSSASTPQTKVAPTSTPRTKTSTFVAPRSTRTSTFNAPRAATNSATNSTTHSRPVRNAAKRMSKSDEDEEL
eukprot:TRINITY_DN8675_c0_g1_i1.p1 TRINITY_DN8675_c0_g1~~TRINITY_DN8675_c0_g1_i1.p1  ORF type:complete len:625 (+),score=174.69 TRINITY_DN8675_c0_g1_i1:110-1876(+)